MVREYAYGQSIIHFYDVGSMGVEHSLLPEEGLVAPGELIIGADSHTCTYDALGAFSTGVGSTDMAYGLITGTTWMRIPDAIGVTLTGGYLKRTRCM
jgi:3-isopropylmalate/(R)-2-methylmalate dehydratase large subunit